jgi:predicted peroxiredoxin
MNRPAIMLIATILLVTAALSGAAAPQLESVTRSPTVVIQLTSGQDDMLALSSALRFAEDARDMGRTVILFFTKAGVRVPLLTMSPDLRFINEPQLTTQQRLLRLQEAGVQFVVCGHAAHMLGVRDHEFLPGTFITESNQAILRRTGSNAVVFTF